MQEKNKRLFENLLSMGTIQVLMYIFPLITAPYITRTIGVEKYGLVAFANAFIQYFTLIVDYGVESSGTYRISTNRHNKNNISNIFNTIMATKTLLFVFCILLLIILILLVPKLREIWLLILFCYMGVLGNVFFPTWFFVGMERMKYMTMLNIFSRTLFVILLFIFIKSPDDYLWLPLLTSSGLIIAGFLSLFVAITKENLKIYVPRWSSIIYQLKYSTQFFWAKVANYGKANTNTFCLGLLSTMSAVGYYNAAYQIYWAICCLISGITLPIYPYMVKNKDLRFYMKFAICTIIAFSTLFIIMFTFAKPIIIIYYGSKMVNAYFVFRIFCIGLFFVLIETLVHNSLLGAYGHMREANNSTIISSIFHFAGLFLLYILKLLNMYSIACLIILSTAISLFIKIYYVIKFKIFQKNNI